MLAGQPPSPAGCRSSSAAPTSGLYDRMGLYALVAIGLTLLMGFAGQVSLGQGGFFLIGAYTSGLADRRASIRTLGSSTRRPASTPLLAVAIAPARQRRRGARDRHPAHAPSRALPRVRDARVRAHRLVAPLRTGPVHRRSVRRDRDEAAFGRRPRRSRGRLTPPSSGASSGSPCCCRRTSSPRDPGGRCRRSPRTSQRPPPSGIDVAAYKLKLFVYAAALAGLAGGLFTFYAQFLGPEDFVIVLSLLFVVMVSIGGLGSVYGAVVGAVTIVWVEHELRDLGTRESLLGLGSSAAGAVDSLTRGLRPAPDRDHALLPARPAAGRSSALSTRCAAASRPTSEGGSAPDEAACPEYQVARYSATVRR